MTISFGGHEFALHVSGALLWPEQDMVIVSDLHLEKSSWYARQGFFLPPYDSHAILENLLSVFERSGMGRLLILGDCFHDIDGYARLSPADRALFDRLAAHNPIWIVGNHDRGFIPPGLSGYQDICLSGLIFRHEAMPGVSGEISGHFHPKAAIRHKGGRVSRFCFIEDGTKMILPSFGVYTGGLDVANEAITKHFHSGFRVHIPGKSRFHTFSHDKL